MPETSRKCHLMNKNMYSRRFLRHHLLTCNIHATNKYSIKLTAALSWSTEKLQTSHVSGSFSFVAKIFLMADR